MDAKPDEQVPAPGEGAPDPGADATSEMMHLLHEGIPLTLIADLASPGGPHSPDILEDEGLPDVAWWGGDGTESADPDADESGIVEVDDDDVEDEA